MKCCRCHRFITAAAAWMDPVETGPGRAIPGALGPACARKLGLPVLKATPAARRASTTRRGRRRKPNGRQLELLP